MVRCVADNHPAKGVVVVLGTECLEVIHHIIQQGLDVGVVLIHRGRIDRTGFNSNGIQDFLHLDLEIGANVFAYETKGVTVGNRGVIVVRMDVIAENVGCAVLSGDNGCAGKSDADCLRVALNQSLEETSGGIIVAVGFINEVYPLNLQVVIILAGRPAVITELLDVDHSNFRLPFGVLGSLVAADDLFEIILGVNRIDNKAALGELLLCLLHKGKAVNDEEELRDNALFGVILSQEFHVVVCECGFSAALCVPDDSFSDILIQGFLYSLRSEYLRVTHDMLLESVRLINVADSIFQ